MNVPDEYLPRWRAVQSALDISRLPGGWLETCFDHGAKSGELDSLLKGFETIKRLGNGEPALLYSDHAPLSFYWTVNNWEGGLIYHGAHDRGGDGGAPTYSVNVNPVNGRAIHT